MLQLRNPRPKGFTLIELMLAITVLAILLAVGVPSFTDLIRNNRSAEQTNDLLAAISLTRSEATKRGMPVSICAANATLNDCAGVAVADWGNGWLIFTDRTGVAGTIDGTDVILRQWASQSNSMRIASGASGFIRFDADGRVMGLSDTFTVRHPKCTGVNQRRLTIDTTGRVHTKKESCS